MYNELIEDAKELNTIVPTEFLMRNTIKYHFATYINHTIAFIK